MSPEIEKELNELLNIIDEQATMTNWLAAQTDIIVNARSLGADHSLLYKEYHLMKKFKK